MLDQPDLRILEGISYATRARRPNRIAWKLVATSAIVLLTSGAVYPFLPRSYIATSDVLLRPTDQEGKTTWDQSVRDALDDNAIQTKIDVLRSAPLQSSVIDKFELLKDAEFNPAMHPGLIRRMAATSPWLAIWLPMRKSDVSQVQANLVRHLSVKRERKSYLIQVGYQVSEPQKASAMTNALVAAFIKDDLARKIGSHQALLAALEDRVNNLHASYHTAEATEHAFIVLSGLDHQGEHELDGKAAR